MTELQYGHFKFAGLLQSLKESMSAFEAYGEQEKTAVANLNTHLEGLDKKLSEIKGF